MAMNRLVIFFSLLLIAISSFAQQNNWSDVEKVFGKKGNVQDNIFKITFSRSDLKVKVGDFTVAPGLAFTSWIGFMKMGNMTTMMGDLVVLDTEVPSVISKLVSLETVHEAHKISQQGHGRGRIILKVYDGAQGDND